jgi:hypothetical protein
MGIYTDGSVYGVKLILKDIVIYEKTFCQKMNRIEIDGLRDIYDRFDELQKTALSIRIYTRCVTTYDADLDSFFSWLPGDRSTLEKFLGL